MSRLLAAFSLLPFVPEELGIPEWTAWRISSGLYCRFGLDFVVRSVRRKRRSMGRILIAGWVTGALLATCGLQVVLLAMNALGVFGGAASGLYFASLFVHFGGAAFFFIRLLYGALPRSA